MSSGDTARATAREPRLALALIASLALGGTADARTDAHLDTEPAPAPEIGSGDRGSVSPSPTGLSALLTPDLAEAWRIARVCGVIEREAKRHDMPPAFLARLINRESRFDDRAVSPVGAQGIAQFMPGTAAMVGLADPFDAMAAIPAAAAHLADLKRRFGNWGLAAAGYNAGPGGVSAFLRGAALPLETRAYVKAITGKRATAFREAKAKHDHPPLAKDTPFLSACTALPAYRMGAPSRLLAKVPRGLSVGRSPAPAAVVAVAASPPAPSKGWGQRLLAAATPITEAFGRAQREARELAAMPVPALFLDAEARPAPVLVAQAGDGLLAAAATPFAANAEVAPAPEGAGIEAGIEVAVAAIAVPSAKAWRRMIGPPHALDVPLGNGASREERNRQICGLIEREASRVGMPAPFFARLINQESRFDPNARSPVGAQGVAQFMPYTAKERGLLDPFDIVQAIPASADYLAEMHAMLGNWGLAAMGYNAGPGRVIDAFNGRDIPPETRNYIAIITSKPWRHFLTVANEVEDVPLDAKLSFMEACMALPTRRISPPKLPGAPAEPWQPWGVQLAASFVEASAVASFDRQVKRYGKVIGERRPLLIRQQRRGTSRSMIAARLGAPTRDEAETLCNRIRGAGGACVVMKNTK